MVGYGGAEGVYVDLLEASVAILVDIEVEVEAYLSNFQASSQHFPNQQDGRILTLDVQVYWWMAQHARGDGLWAI